MSEAENKPPFQLAERQMQLAEHVRQVYHVTVPEGHTFEELLAPEAWAHVSSKLRPGDHIEVVPEDGSYVATLFVVTCDKLWARVHVLSMDDLTVARADAAQLARAVADFEAIWKGPVKKFCIVRKSDGGLLHEGVQTKVEAERWLADHVKTIAA